MPTKTFVLFLAAALLAVRGVAVARHVTHPVTPANISEQPFSFTVHVKDAGEMKEFEIVVKAKAGGAAPVLSATGEVVVARSATKEPNTPPVRRVQANGVQTYTFRLAPADLDRATFTFTESPRNVEFPSPGDYWTFQLGRFVGNPSQ
jgi:hypothetical protein